MLSATKSRVLNPVAGGSGSEGLMLHAMRGLDDTGVGNELTAAHVESTPVRIRDESLRAELTGTGGIDAQQLNDLVAAFDVIAQPDAVERTIVLPELRAILRVLGCESVASGILDDLQALNRYRHGQIRRPPMSLLKGLHLLEPPSEGGSLGVMVTPRTARHAEEVKITFDDFLRILSRGQLRRFLPDLPCSSALHTLTLFGAIYDMAASSAGQRLIDRSDLMVACAGVNTHLSQLQMDELWGIMANSDVTNAQRNESKAVNGWLTRRSQARKKRVWCTLNETGRGRLQFRDREDGAATKDFLSMANCVRVYHASGHHSRREFFGLFGARQDAENIEHLTARLHAVWDEIDEDNNGFLSEAELRIVLQRMGTTMTDKKFSRWMKQLDTDRSGQVEFEELEFWVRKQSEEARNLLSLVQLDTLWDEIDLDGSGELDSDELEAVLDKMGQPVGPRKLQKLMHRLDTDGNGTVSKEEFSVWWKVQSDVARSHVAMSVDEDEDEDEAEADAADGTESTTIGIVMRDPATGRERHHMLEAPTKEDMRRWLDALEESRLFHHNYDRSQISFGEFLLGMATVPSTPLADCFDMFASATGTRRQKDGSMVRVSHRAGSTLVDRPVDEVRAKELYEALGAMEKFGVSVVKREQKKRDKSEMMARLQQANHNQLHMLSEAEQKRMRKIERGAVRWCFTYGLLSALVSGAFELLVGWELGTSDGIHYGTSYLAPNATCDADLDLCATLDHRTMVYYWLFAIAIPVGVCAVFEIGAIYLHSLRSAMRFVGVVGIQLLPLDDSRLFVALSLTRAVLELGNEEDAMTGVLDPLREMNKCRLLLCSLLYKARIGISNFALKIGLKRVVSRSVARSALPFAPAVGTAVWNGLTARKLMTEARVRAMGVASSVEVANDLIQRLHPADLSELAKLQAARAVACTVVQKQTLHPNHQHLLLHILHHVGLEKHEARVSMHASSSSTSYESDFDGDDLAEQLDCTETFLSELAQLTDDEGAMVVGLVCLSIVIDARATKRSLRFYGEVLESLCTGNTPEIAAFPNSSVELEEIALEFSRGKPLDVEDLIRAVGRREVRELKETTQRTCAQNLAYWPWHLLSECVSCVTHLV